jgi:endonuclease YncB( thermonuclease family)
MARDPISAHRRAFSEVFLAACWALGTAALLFAGPAHAESYDGTVQSVIDGDTIEVLTDGSPKELIRVRLAGIDTPEHDQPWGDRARRALSERVQRQSVRINAVTIDRYGRVVGEVYANDVCVGCELVRGGHAWVYRRYTDDAALIRLERDAREHGRGLWSLPPADRVPPWEWRRGRRQAESSAPAADAPEGCGTKTYCKEMTSCEEARFYLLNCGSTRLDGDGDGTPCEKLCGG